MPHLHLLGTGAAISSAHRTTTMLAFSSDQETVVVDCGGDVVQRLLQAGVDLDTIASLIVTHEHPDHVSGFPLFMEKIWLSGRRRPIDVRGIRPAIDQARRCFETFDTSGWEEMPELRWHEVRHEESAPVFESDHWHIVSSPGTHAVPVIGLRVTHKPTQSVVTYSCDTEPAQPIERLARNADILVHEATGEQSGHTSPRQAAAIAARAGAGRLLLVHLPPSLSDEEIDEARSEFAETELGEELGRYSLSVRASVRPR